MRTLAFVFIIYHFICVVINAQDQMNETKCANFSANYSFLLSSKVTLSWQIIDSDGSICISIEKSGNDGWLGFGFARTLAMISDPPANVIVYSKDSKPMQYILAGRSTKDILALSDQSSVKIIQYRQENQKMSVLFWRRLGANLSSDVDIKTTGPSSIIWATGDVWLRTHNKGDCGRAKINFMNGRGGNLAVAVHGDFVYYIALGTLLVYIIIGVLVTRIHVVANSRCLNRLRQIRIGLPRWEEPMPPLGYLLDLTVADGMLLLFYAGMNLLVITLCYIKFHEEGAKGNALVVLVTGKLSAVNLALLLFPVSRWNLLNWIFRTNFTQTIKFHRAIGIYTVYLLASHFFFAFNCCESIFSPEQCGSQMIVPLYGVLAFVCFCSMGILSMEHFRRHSFEVFYYSHRILSLLGLIFVGLHSKTVRILLIAPLILYSVGYLSRFRSYCKIYHVSSISVSNEISIIKIPADQAWQNKLLKMKFGAYCFLCVPGISYLEWHPFTIISSYQEKKNVTLAIRNMGRRTFTGKLHRLCEESLAFPVYLDGPFGAFSIDILRYNTLILVAGGIGVTPFIPVLSFIRRNPTMEIRVIFIWCVQSRKHFIALEECLFADEIPKNDSHLQAEDSHIIRMLYATKESYIGASSIALKAGGQLAFSCGHPDLMEICRSEAKLDRRVAVLASAPYGLTGEAQRAAQTFHLDFHKETFGW